MAFRDIALEVISRRMLETYFKTSKLGDKSFIPDSVLLEEPHKISESVEFSKTIQGLLDISFRAWNIRISGLQDSRIEEFHFVRHIGRKHERESHHQITFLYLSLDYLPVFGAPYTSLQHF